MAIFFSYSISSEKELAFGKSLSKRAFHAVNSELERFHSRDQRGAH
jgi:hypothetical protein